MGNRGMTNWKLGAFFVMSLMLVAAVFSNTAMAAANDGKGKVTVGWGSRTSVAIDTTGILGEDDLNTAVSVGIYGVRRTVIPDGEWRMMEHSLFLLVVSTIS